MKRILGCTTVGYVNFSLERALKGIARAGLRYVELGAIPGYCEHVVPDKLDKKGIKTLKDILLHFDLTPISLSGHSDLTTREGLDYLKRCLEIASKLQLTVVNTGTGQTETPKEEENFFKNIEELAEYAERIKIKVGLETQNLMLTSGMKIVEVMKQINSPWVGINFDSANVVFWSGKRPENEIQEFASYVVHMHMKDKRGGKGIYDFPPVGEGEIDFSFLLNVLEDTEYDGPFILEPELCREKDKKSNEVAEALEDPSLVYSKPHSYLGVHDPDLIDDYLLKSTKFVQKLFKEIKGDQK
jgi:sugar phosphate isomerase/epimerase